ncbi:MAG: heavy metal translocating P-type ATPase [Desulfobacteraceae bacterium]|nr:heavy metal translocating P-type ATPase [Desulfobacteraceae bacterium]
MKTSSSNGSGRCELCGLDLPRHHHTLSGEQRHHLFCCMGCKMVYSMLSEAAGAPDPAGFRETQLYRQCKAAGIIPSSADDLAEIHTSASPVADTATPSPDGQFGLPLVLYINGMWCPACAWVIEATVKKQPGVRNVTCNFATDQFRCEYDPVRTRPGTIAAAIDNLGYPAVDSAERSRDASRQRSDFIRLILSIFFSANVMMLSIALYSGFFTTIETDGVWKISVPIGVMATFVFFYGGWPIHKKGWYGLRAGKPGMEALILMGSSAAFLLSVVNLFQASLHLYFDTAAMLITLVLLGKLLENRAKTGIQKDLDTFFTLSPKKVRICSDAYPGGRYAGIGQLRKSDNFRLVAGEVSPADGTILSGNGRVDESAVTGEARPIGVKPGSLLKSGTRIVQGDLSVRADRVGPDSLLGQMIDTMNRALDQKIRLEGKTDRMLRFFVPAIAALAAVTVLGCLLSGLPIRDAIIRGVTVLVISCPCALGIAIPLARVAGIGSAAARGILIRNFSSFDNIGGVDAFILDKTGTLTTGNWSMVRMWVPDPNSADEMLSVAAGLEENADHPIAIEIRAAAEKKGIAPAAITETEHRENGVIGRWKGLPVRIGSRRFSVPDKQGVIPGHINQASPQEAVLSHIFMSVADRLAAVFSFGDQIRNTAGATIDELKKGARRIVLVSGDEQTVTRQVAAQLDIDEYHGAMKPGDKADVVAGLSRSGYVTAMVGDGVNDAPALAAADLSVALYSGYHMGKEAADITLMRGEPDQLLDFLHLARRVTKNILQNLWASSIYNICCIPLAIIGVFSPLVAATAMLLSSLSVTGNTLLFIRRDRGKSDRTKETGQ